MSSNRFKYICLALLALTLALVAVGCGNDNNNKETGVQSTPLTTTEPTMTLAPTDTNETTETPSVIDPTITNKPEQGESSEAATATPKPAGGKNTDVPNDTAKPIHTADTQPSATSKPVTNATTSPSNKPGASSKPAPTPTAKPATAKPTGTPAILTPSTNPTATPKPSQLPIGTPSATDKPTPTPSSKPDPVDPNADVTAEAISTKIISDISLGPLLTVEGEKIKEIFGIDPATQLSEGVFHQSSLMIQAAEFSVIKLKSGTQYEAVSEGFKNRALEIQKTFKSYLDDQYELAQNYQIIRNGDYVLFSISPEQKKLADLFNDFFTK